jgi:hypothetical protein
MVTIVKQTADFSLVVDTNRWEGNQKGDLGYRIINRKTGVCEGEGNILVSASRYIDLMQENLDDYNSGIDFTWKPEPDGDVH